MDDVLDRVVPWTLAAALVLKVAEFTSHGRPRDAAIMAACVVLLGWSVRAGALAAAIAIGTLALHNNHEFFLLSVAVVTAIFDDPADLRLLWRTQLTALWFYAGTAKLKSDWTSGAVLDRGEVLLPVPEGLLIWGTVAVELVVLPVLLWVAPRWAWRAGLAFQTAVAVGMSTFVPDHLPELWAFNLLTVAVLWAATRPRPSSTPAPSRGRSASRR